MESSHFFSRQFSVTPSIKCCSSIFHLGPLSPKFTPQNFTKSPISRPVWQIDRICLGLLGGFRGWPTQWHHAKCCGPTLVAMAVKFGLGVEIQSPTGLLLLFLCTVHDEKSSKATWLCPITRR